MGQYDEGLYLLPPPRGRALLPAPGAMKAGDLLWHHTESCSHHKKPEPQGGPQGDDATVEEFHCPCLWTPAFFESFTLPRSAAAPACVC